MRKFLILLIIPLVANSDTTGNLITNGTFDNGSTGWTLTGDARVMNDCCPGGKDLEFGDSGSAMQEFKLYTESITEPMLDNGISFRSVTEWQNGEGGIGSWCPNCGDADTFTVRLQVKDNQGNVLATSTQSRQDITGINGVQFEDTVTYLGTGSRVGNIYLSGVDASAPAYMGGPNVDNVELYMDYSSVVLTQQQTEELQEIAEQIEEVYIEELTLEEIFIEPIVEEVYIEPVTEVVEITAEEEFIEETIVLAPEVIEQEIVSVEPEVQVEESVEVIEEVFEEIVEAPVEETNETEVVEETERDTEVDESNTTVVAEETETPNNSRGVETELTIEEISIKVADKIKTIDGQLKATQMIVAKVMARDNKISSYSQVNTDIFIQPELQSIDISTYTNNTYVDIRNIYPNQTYEDRLWTSRQ